MADKIRIETSKPAPNIQLVNEYFKESFTFRTEVLHWRKRQVAVFQQSHYIFREAELMLGIDQLNAVHSNAHHVFNYIDTLLDAQTQWRGFLYCMSNLTSGSLEIREVADVNDVKRDNQNYPELICVMNHDQTVRQALLSVSGFTVTGFDDWKQAVKGLLLLYLVLGYDVNQRTQALKCLATLFLGLTDLTFCTLSTQKFIASFKIASQ